MVLAMFPKALKTQRLTLRRWQLSDLEPFAELNADPGVMEFFPARLDRQQTAAMIERIEKVFEESGYGLWAVEVDVSRSFIGFVGLWPATFEAPFTPAVEIGWRLARRYWGFGYASEAARAGLADGFERLGLDEVVSFTSVLNEPSRRVMQGLGMHRDESEDFDHPGLPVGHRLRRHLLYRISRPA